MRADQQAVHTGSSSYSKPSNSGSHHSSSHSSGNPYDSYDKGYEDVYENGDYDDDLYNRDDDYADGVDDAMDELDW